jgi:PAT family beta-lactamase induction signal transducer AmpG
VVAQAALLLATLGLAWVAAGPQHIGSIWIAVFLIAFASASQDIAVDAYAVEVLRPEEQGVAAGARAAVARFALTLSGRIAITAATWLSWPILFAAQAVAYPAAAALMVFSPEPESVPAPPRSLREAVWEPFVGFLRQHRALEITSFLVLYKFGDNLASALVSPFLIETGYDKLDVGIIFFWIGFAGTVVGPSSGAPSRPSWGSGTRSGSSASFRRSRTSATSRSRRSASNRPLMYSTMFFDPRRRGWARARSRCSSCGSPPRSSPRPSTRCFRASSRLGRTASGPLAGVLVDAIGWPIFFWLTIVAAAPGCCSSAVRASRHAGARSSRMRPGRFSRCDRSRSPMRAFVGTADRHGLRRALPSFSRRYAPCAPDPPQTFSISRPCAICSRPRSRRLDDDRVHRAVRHHLRDRGRRARGGAAGCGPGVGDARRS